MKKNNVGRPKKQNAVKSGQLKKGERRYTLITTEENVKRIKKEASEKKIKIKEYINIVLKYYWESNQKKINNEQNLKHYLKRGVS